MGKTKLGHAFLVPEPFYLFIPVSVLWPNVALVKHREIRDLKEYQQN